MEGGGGRGEGGGGRVEAKRSGWAAGGLCRDGLDCVFWGMPRCKLMASSIYSREPKAAPTGPVSGSKAAV